MKKNKSSHFNQRPSFHSARCPGHPPNQSSLGCRGFSPPANGLEQFFQYWEINSKWWQEKEIDFCLLLIKVIYPFKFRTRESYLHLSFTYILIYLSFTSLNFTPRPSSSLGWKSWRGFSLLLLSCFCFVFLVFLSSLVLSFFLLKFFVSFRT